MRFIQSKVKSVNVWEEAFTQVESQLSQVSLLMLYCVCLLSNINIVSLHGFVMRIIFFLTHKDDDDSRFFTTKPSPHSLS